MQKRAEIDEARMDNILATHVIDPLCLRCDDFDEFFRLRQSALLQRIEQAMGKAIAFDSTLTKDDFGEDEEE